MPSYDSARDCHVLRIVYDGPGLAGKTTNLRQVCQLIPAQRRTELYTPAELKGRTMFFDWMELDAPPQPGKQLKVQLITVPGQIQRNYRRKPLVEMADVVVFVCDSTEPQMPDTLRTFARLRATVKSRKSQLPIVIQANKQDSADAVPLDKMRRKLRVAPEVPILPAAAISGRGVRETLSTALRVGLENLRGEEVVPLAAAFANADALFDHVLTFEDAPPSDEPVDAEELDVGAEDVAIDDAAYAAHLVAESFDSLEARARRAAQRGSYAAPAEPEQESEESYTTEDERAHRHRTRAG